MTNTLITGRMESPSAPLLHLIFIITLLPHLSSPLNPDGLLLLSFKASILNDPLSVLASWSSNDTTPCSWNGVTCTTNSTVISLILPGSHLLGSLPSDLGLIEHLHHLDLSGNFLNGTLPVSLFNATNLLVLSLASNDISGDVPELRLASLQVLNLSDNALTGSIPRNLSLLPNLTVLSLANNYISGGLPGGGFRDIQVLDLSSNLINGSLPRDLIKGRGLRYLNLSFNRLAGEIPPEMGTTMLANAKLDLSFNNLTGQIPSSPAFLSQRSISFAGNLDLCGRPLKNLCKVTATISDPPNGTSLDPSAPKSTPALAAIPRNPNGDSQGGSSAPAGLRPAAVLAIIVGDLGGIGILFVVFMYIYQTKKNKKKNIEKGGTAEKQLAECKGLEGLTCCLKKKESDSDATSESSASSRSDEEEEQKAGKSETDQKHQGAMLVTVDGEREMELETLLKASAYILGATASSILYKAVLANGTALAVRRIDEGGTVNKVKDFEAQVRGIAKFRHPNLLRIRGFYWGADEKLIIHDYATNGSLANVNFSKKLGSSPFHLSWESRLRIAKGVASCLTYLHDKKCVHANIKPSNILLDANMVPLIADFGLERLMLGDTRNKSTRHFGSKRSTQSLPELSTTEVSPFEYPINAGPPYQAPELLKSLKPNTRWDVYSFGIVLLELLAGRLFSETELYQWNAGFMVEEKSRVLRMADPALRTEVEGKEVELLVCFKLGFACAAVAPQRRPSMKDAYQVLDRIPSISTASY